MTKSKSVITALIVILFVLLAVLLFFIRMPDNKGDRIITEDRTISEDTSGKYNINLLKLNELILLDGINDTLAMRIIVSRYLYNGFDDISKLNNVYGIGASLYEKISDRLYAGEYDKSYDSKVIGSIQKVDINSATLSQLAEIDNMGDAVAEKIIEHRAKTGKFISINELSEIDGISKDRVMILEFFLKI